MVADNDDFTANLLSDSGITAIRTPVTKTLLFDGSEELTEGDTENITVFYNPSINSHIQERYGLLKNTDAYIMVGPSQTINKEDKITVESTVYRVINVRDRNNVFGTTSVYKFCELHLIEV